VGQTVELTLEGVREPFEGTIAFIDPVVDTATRTARVRVEVDDAADLRPGMFAEAVVVGGAPEAALEAPLVIPHTAPLFTGRRSLVYVELPETDEPTYAPRQVRLGPRIGDHYPVLSGLNEGERVVVHGAFALDADLQIRGGASMMTGEDDTQSWEVPAAFLSSVAAVLRAYLQVQADLADDDLERKLKKKLEARWIKSPKWITDYDRARAEAKRTGKVIFAYFTRSYAY